MEQDLRDELDYINGRITGLSVQVAAALTKSRKTQTSLQDYVDGVIAKERLERSTKWIEGFSYGVGLVWSLGDEF